MKHSGAPPASQRPALLTLEEAQRALGVSRTTLWRWCREGFLETSELEGRSFVRRSDVLRLRSMAKSISRGQRKERTT